MCWNSEVSLNTFLFSSFVLILVIYNNNYTQYKIVGFNDLWIYILAGSVISMQLVEFFIWRNINNSFYNNIFSAMGSFLIYFHPFASLMLIKDNPILRFRMILLYFVFLISNFGINLLFHSNQNLKSFFTNYFSSVISKNEHLKWNYLDNKDILHFIFTWGIYLFFFLFSSFYNKKYFIPFFAFILLLIMFYFYSKDGTVGSMWCWIINLFSIYFAVYLLFYLPYKEKMSIVH